MIRKFNATNFKSLLKVDLELGRVNVFIGANGSGKSNILEAFGVLSAAAYGTVDEEALLRRGVRPGVPRLYKSAFKHAPLGQHISFKAIGADGPNYLANLHNPLERPKPFWEYKHENWKSKERSTKPIVSRYPADGNHFNRSRGLAALKMVERDSEDPAVVFLKSLQDYCIYCPNTPTLRGIQPDPQSRVPLGLSGGGLAEAFAVLKKLSVTDESLEEALDEAISLIDWVESVDTTSQFANLLAASVPRTKRTIRFRDKYLRSASNSLTPYDASEGSLYILFSSLLALSPDGPRFFAIDNMDQALNPRLLSQLMTHFCQWILDSDKQVLLTIQNPSALDGLPLSVESDDVRLFAVDRTNKGNTQIKQIEITPEFIRLKDQHNYSLSQMWVEGLLGGVPSV